MDGVKVFLTPGWLSEHHCDSHLVSESNHGLTVVTNFVP